MRELEAWGAVFDRQRTGAFSSEISAVTDIPVSRGDRTGLEMIRTLQDHGVHQGIDVHMENTTLLIEGRRPDRWRFWLRARAGRFKIFRAKAVVLATGGLGRAYKITSNSWNPLVTVLALAYDAGAELIDMEFVQFHPTGMIWPPSVMGILVTEGVRGGRRNPDKQGWPAFYVRLHP